MLKNLAQPATVDELKDRIAKLRPNSERLWGKMNAAQALAHCSAALEWAVGDSRPPRMFAGRIIGVFIKYVVLKDDQPMRRNSSTVKTLVVTDERNLKNESERLCVLIDRFTTVAPKDRTPRPHSFFGRLTYGEWAVLTYKHLDHHLRQFGV